ncbi:MAG: ATP-binding cassette domain-containing protein [Syntrophales bacterium]|nr:ATP-binding cassette domain-containing protein [Syntrophales bacterium]
MSLRVSIRKKLKYFDLDIDFSCSDDELLALIGPSGSGKTTIVRMITGLDKPDEGQIVFGDEVWFDSEKKIHVSPQKRRLGYVFQDYTLFPHLNLRDNVGFAACNLKVVDDLLTMFGIDHLDERKPDNVSGGERQRCAICQALARKPQALLLDEPFSALDFVTRRKLRRELKLLKEKTSFPIVYVTHEIQEAFSLADEILPIVDGRIDKEWLSRSLEPVPPADTYPRAARGERLALAL